MHKYLIEVTQDDIDTGIPFDASKCPLAKAMSRALGRTILAGAYVWGFDDDGDYTPNYLLSDLAIDFRTSFDRGEGVSPISFEVELP